MKKNSNKSGQPITRSPVHRNTLALRVRKAAFPHIDSAASLPDEILRHHLVLDHVSLLQRRPGATATTKTIAKENRVRAAPAHRSLVAGRQAGRQAGFRPLQDCGSEAIGDTTLYTWNYCGVRAAAAAKRSKEFCPTHIGQIICMICMICTIYSHLMV